MLRLLANKCTAATGQDALSAATSHLHIAWELRNSSLNQDIPAAEIQHTCELNILQLMKLRADRSLELVSPNNTQSVMCPPTPE